MMGKDESNIGVLGAWPFGTRFHKAIRARRAELVLRATEILPCFTVSVESPSVRQRIAHHFKRVLRAEAVSDVWTDALGVWLTCIIGLSLLGATPACVRFLLAIKWDSWLQWLAVWLGAIVGSAVCFLVMVLLVLAVIRVDEAFGKTRKWVLATLMFVIAVPAYSVASTYQVDRVAPSIGLWAIMSLSGAAQSMTAMAAISTCVFGFQRWADWRANYKRPVSVVVVSLIRAIEELGRLQRAWEDWACRREMLGAIERAALVIESRWPTLVSHGSVASDTAMKAKARSIAWALRRHKITLSMPSPEKHVAIQEELRSNLMSVLKGDWASLPEGEPVEHHGSILAMFGRGLRMLTIGLAPISLVIGCRQAGLLHEGPSFQWAMAGAIAWMVMSVLAPLDPHFPGKVEAGERIFNVFKQRSSPP
jgi:hypothetical protein